MKITLTGIHPNTYDGEVKDELSSLQYPVEVEVEKFDFYRVVSPEPYHANIAWYLTNDPYMNKIINDYWNKYGKK